jgi:hypothetical protein
MDNKYLFSGKLVCGFCGWKMRGRMDRKNKVYICSKYNKNGNCKRNKIHETSIIEKINEENIDIDKLEIITIDKNNIYIKVS